MAAFVVASTFGSVARADKLGGPRIGVDLEYAIPISDDFLDAGPGGALRLGYELDAVALSITPEIGGSYHSFDDASIYRGLAGLRLSFLKILEPGVFAHIGFAHTSLDLPIGDDPSWTGLAYDVGGFLDFTLLPLIEFGIHGGYSYVAPEDSDADGFDWAMVGAHGTLAF